MRPRSGSARSPGRSRRDPRDRPPDRGARPRREREARGVPRARDKADEIHAKVVEMREKVLSIRARNARRPGSLGPLLRQQNRAVRMRSWTRRSSKPPRTRPKGPSRERESGDRPMKSGRLGGRRRDPPETLTYKRPKPLIPVAGRPCIDYVLRSLAASGFHEIIVTTAYLSTPDQVDRRRPRIQRVHRVQLRGEPGGHRRRRAPGRHVHRRHVPRRDGGYPVRRRLQGAVRLPQEEGRRRDDRPDRCRGPDPIRDRRPRLEGPHPEVQLEKMAGNPRRGKRRRR